MDIKKRLIIDMDGVLADIYEQLIKLEFEETGTKIDRKNTLGKTEIEAFPNCLKHVNQKGFFRNIPVMPLAINTLKKLNEKYEVFIVSSATEFPNSLEEKYYWIEENFPFISWKQLVLCGTKTVIKGDIMIDDHFKNLDFFAGKTFLFTQPHNYEKNENSHKRVNNWDEISKFLL